MTKSPSEEMFAVGVIRGTHGLDGRVKVESLSGETRHFSGMSEVTIVRGVKSEIVKIESVSASGGSLIMKLAGVDFVDDAKLFVGSEIWATRESAAPLDTDEYYYRDLCRCSVIVNGEVAGKVTGVSSAGARDLLEITLVGGRVVMVPFQDEFVGRVNVSDRLVEVKTPWIFE